MKTTIYLDVLFCVNFIVDYMMLLSVRKMMALNVRRRRLLAGAAVGGLGSFAVLLPPMPVITSLLLSLMLNALMTAAAFLPVGIIRFLKCVLALFTVSFLYGGVMTAALASGNFKNLTVRNGAVYIGIHPLVLIALTLICYGGLQLFYVLAPHKAGVIDRCRVRAVIGEITVDAQGITDTGNTLHEPFSGECVVVMKRELYPAMPDMKELAVGGSENRCRSVRMIPFHSVGGSGVLPAIRPSEIIIEYKNKEVRVSAYLAFSEGADFSEGCDCIVPAELIRKGC